MATQAETRFFQTAERKFTDKLAEPLKERRWEDVNAIFYAYGVFMETHPEALDIPTRSK